LQLGERLLLASGSAAVVTETRVETLASPVKVYNFEVADWHTYFVSGSRCGAAVWVHNLCKLYTQRDSLNRITAVVARVRPADLYRGTSATNSARAFVRAVGKAGDDAGHFIAELLGGPGGKKAGNIFAQNAHINRGVFRDFERDIARYIRNNNVTAYIRATPSYATPTAMRPNGIRYRVRFSDGTPDWLRRFGN
jgi:hypothetical protein